MSMAVAMAMTMAIESNRKRKRLDESEPQGESTLPTICLSPNGPVNLKPGFSNPIKPFPKKNWRNDSISTIIKVKVKK